MNWKGSLQSQAEHWCHLMPKETNAFLEETTFVHFSRCDIAPYEKYMTQLVKDLNMARQHEILPWRLWMCLLSGHAWAHCCACHNTEVTSHMRCAICVSGWQSLHSLRWMVSVIGLYNQALNNNELDEIHGKKS